MQTLIFEPDAFPASAVQKLRELGPVALGLADAGAAAAQVIFIRLSARIDAAFHSRFPNLRWIVSPTTGLNHVDLAYFESKAVAVLSLRGRTEFLDTIHATAEHTLALALALFRHVAPASEDVAAGHWNRDAFKGRELYGKTVLIYGYGRIGRLVTPLYQAFGCRVLAYDIVPGRVPEALHCDLDYALGAADLLSVHLPLNPSTTNLLDAEFLSRLSPHAIVVNTARGELFDQHALFDALEQDRLAGAALDVLWGEPQPLNEAVRGRLGELRGRLLVTPHIGGFTHESLGAVEMFMADLLVRTVRGA